MRRHSLLGIIGICSGIANMALCFSSLNTILAVIQQDLHASTEELQWILNVYGIFIAPFLVIMGRLGDRYGYKKIFCLGLFFLVLSTFGTAFSPNATGIIIAQAFFGLAGASLLPLSQTLLMKLLGPEKESIAMSLWTTSGGTLLAFGPILAGVLTELGSWRIPFIVMGIVSLASLILSILYVEDPKRNNPPALDLRGTILLMFTIILFVLAVMETGTWRNSLVVGLYLASLILLIVLLILEKSVSSPIIQEELFKHRAFLCSAMANALLIFFVWAYLFLIPLYLQNTLKKSILETGCLMLFLTAPMALLSSFVGKLYPTVGAKRLILLGYACLIICDLLGLQLTAETSIWFIAIPNALFGIGWAVIMAPAATEALSILDRNHTGTGAGTFNTLQEIAGVVGLAIIVTIVRLHSNFISGMHEGFWTILIFLILGLCFALALKNVTRKTVHIQEELL